MIRRAGFLIVCAFLVLAQSEPEVGVTDGLERVFLHDPVPEGREVFIRTARNEYEPFQIVVKSGHTADITVRVHDLYENSTYVILLSSK